MMQDLQTLIAEHDHMDDLAEQLIAIATDREDVTGALCLRATLSISLEDHLSREDSFLYDQLLGATDKVFPAAVLDFRRSFADLAADWGDYLSTWDAECIRADWASFAAETIAIMHRLRARIADENALLYPLALQKGHIRLRAAA
jgi:hypothetical protein